MSLKKQGQITVFIIIGILLLVSVTIYLSIYFNVFQFWQPDIDRIVKIPIEPSSIRDYVTGCIRDVSRPLLFEIARKGGTFQPEIMDFVNYTAVESTVDNDLTFMAKNSEVYTYACHAELGHGCVSNLITRQEMERELNQKIREMLPSCLNMTVFSGQGYEYVAGDMKVDTKVAVDDVSVTLDYPMTFTQSDKTLSFTEFTSSLDVPLGRVFDLGLAITNDEAKNNHFEASEWMLKHNVDVKIYKHKPYPDIVYELAKKIDRTGEILRYNFALQGRDTAGEICMQRSQDSPFGWCLTPQDNNCYLNVKQDECNVKKGIYSDQMPNECRGLTTFVEAGCPDGICNSCGAMQNGESWCQFDGPPSPGFDFVGSRHFLRSCIDGEVFYEECRDYREEICTSWKTNESGKTLKKSTCRPNNWQKCAKQTNAVSCSLAGDCYWSDWLNKPTENINPPRIMDSFFIKIDGSLEWKGFNYGDDILRPYPTRKCIPYTPPGFKHWKGDGAQVCAMANQVHDEDYESGPQAFVDSANAYCYFLGDCGNYYNFADQYTASGFFATETLKPDNNVREPFELFPGMTVMADAGLFAIPQKNSTLSWKPQNLSGQECVDARASFRNAFSKESDFWQFAQSEYTKGNFESHVMGHIESHDFPITIHYGIRHMELCNIWGAPQSTLGSATNAFGLSSGGILFSQRNAKWSGSQTCDLCNSEAKDSHKPCSEYRCRSLGTGCVYYVEDGVGKCKASQEADKIPPVIYPPKLLSSDLTIENSTLMASSQVYSGVRICHNSCTDDNILADGIEPYTTINLGLSFSKPTQCKLSYFPSYDYRGIPIMFVTMFLSPIPILDGMDISDLFGHEFKTEVNVSIPVYPESLITSMQMNQSVSASLLELAFYPVDFEEMMITFATSMTQTMNELGDSSDAQVIDQWVISYFTLKPRIDETFKSAQGALNLILTEKSAGNTVIFFDCIDQNGNPNNEFFIKYAIGRDTSPPKLVGVEPASNSNLNSKVQTVTLKLNEPADCKYSINENMSYEQMPHYFDCQTTKIQSLDKTFHCTAFIQFDSPRNDLYVKCRDQPLPVRDYSITLAGSTEAAINNPQNFGSTISVTQDNNITVNYDYVLLMNPVVNVTGDVNLKMFTAADSTCKYSLTKEINFGEIPESQSMQCLRLGNSTMCQATIPFNTTDEQLGYAIKCIDTQIYSFLRNTNPDSFVVHYTT